jgi:fructose/tagatose bisphosphate aldolase
MAAEISGGPIGEKRGKMSFLNAEKALRKAAQEKYCLGAYNVDNMESTRALGKATEEERAPIIIEAGEHAVEGIRRK